MNDSSGRGRSPRWPRPRGTRAAAVMTAVAGVALLAAACGVSSSSSTAAGGSTYYQKAVAYAQCMRSHGEPSYPDPDSQGQFPPIQEGRSGISPQAVQSAQDACRNLQPGGGPGTAGQQQARLTQALDYSRCMRARGVPDFPDPSTSNSGVGYNLSGVDTQSAQYLSANRACQLQSAKSQPSAGTRS